MVAAHDVSAELRDAEISAVEVRVAHLHDEPVYVELSSRSPAPTKNQSVLAAATMIGAPHLAARYTKLFDSEGGKLGVVCPALDAGGLLQRVQRQRRCGFRKVGTNCVLDIADGNHGDEVAGGPA